MKKFIFILLILQPFIVKLVYKAGFQINVFNELLSLLVLTLFIFRILIKRKFNNTFLIYLGFLVYTLLLGIYRNIMPLSLFQILIYSQFFFYFFYFQSFSDQEKCDMMKSMKNIMDFIIVVVAIIAIIEVIDYQSFRNFIGVHSVNRGINGFYLISFFGSGPSLAIFISLYVFVWHYYYYALEHQISRKDISYLFLAIVLGVLSFSRKETLFIFMFILLFPYPSKSKLRKWLKRLILSVAVFAGLLYYYLTFFESANMKGFDSGYIRWKIMAKSIEVYSDYFPFGTGAGTFGSRVSLMMPHIYEEYNVGQGMLGWEATNSRGPIYDAFLSTFVTEIGVGVLLIMFLFYKLFESKTILRNNFSEFIKNFILIYLLSLSFFVPMLTNSFGYIIMIILSSMAGNISLFKIRTRY